MSQQEIAHTAIDIAPLEEKIAEEKVAVQWKPTQRSEPVEMKRTDHTQENGNPDGAVSLCFPFVHKNVRPEKVFAVMRRPKINMSMDRENPDIREVNLGFIERIDYIFRRDGHKTFFVHFADGRFSRNTQEREILAEMVSGRRFQIYNDREQAHYWWCSVSKAKRPEDRNSSNTETGTSADISLDLQ